MRGRCRVVVVLLTTTILIVSCSSGPSSPSAPPTSPAAAKDAGPAVLTPLLASVISPPVPVPATDGKVHLAYELQLTNALDQELMLTSVGVRAGDQTLLNLPGDRLTYWTRVLGSPTPTNKLGPAQSAAVWLDVALDKAAAVPAELVHSIGISLPQPQPPLVPATLTETIAPVSVQTRKPPIISPPLVGPDWLDANSCCDMTPHRMALNPLNGQLWAAERFAIDYVQLGPDLRMFHGDKTKPESYVGYGADIHAVADGRVVAVLDGLPEQVPGKNPTGLPLDQYGGNHIVEVMTDGDYAFYGHLKTGSIKVQVGDRTKPGQVIASLGNTGNSDGPHLHFHIMSGPDPLRSDGLPFVLSSFTLTDRIASMDAHGAVEAGQPAPMQPGFDPRDESEVSPLVLDVMSYAGN